MEIKWKFLQILIKIIARNITFQGSGCSISIASASILTKVLLNKNLLESKTILDNFIDMIENRNYSFDNVNDEKKIIIDIF